MGPNCVVGNELTHNAPGLNLSKDRIQRCGCLQSEKGVIHQLMELFAFFYEWRHTHTHTQREREREREREKER